MQRCLTVSAFVLMIAATGVSAQGMGEEDCTAQASIVTDAVELRKGGSSADEALNDLRPKYEELGAAYTDQIIPALVMQYVYAQSEAVLDQDLAGVWKQTCLTTDLSSVLQSQ